MESTINQVKELGQRVEQLSDRITSLEKDSAFMTDGSEEHAERLLTENQNSNDQLEIIQETISVMNGQLKNVRIALDTVIRKLRESIRESDLAEINERVETWAPESYATKRDLKEYIDD